MASTAVHAFICIWCIDSAVLKGTRTSSHHHALLSSVVCFAVSVFLHAPAQGQECSSLCRSLAGLENEYNALRLRFGATAEHYFICYNEVKRNRNPSGGSFNGCVMMSCFLPGGCADGADLPMRDYLSRLDEAIVRVRERTCRCF
jgi:hypothetical protein